MKKALYEFYNYFPFLKEIIKRDFKRKYYKSILGVAWSMLSPLLIMIVMTIVFSTLFNRSIPHYPIYLFTGSLIFNFVFDGATICMGCILGNAGLINKMKIPNYFFCISSVTQSFITLLLSFVPFFGVCAVTGVPLNMYMLLLPLRRGRGSGRRSGSREPAGYVSRTVPLLMGTEPDICLHQDRP